MKLDALAGNAALKQQLSAQEKGRGLSHAYLISGPAGSGKKTLARLLSAAMVCTGDGEKPCGSCAACKKVFGNIHPDVIQVGSDGKDISVGQAREARSDAYIRPNEGRRKVYIIDPADAMNPAAQNALLKVLEEGPSYAAFLLLAERPGLLLDTVRSRCELLALPPEAPRSDPELVEQAGSLARLLLTGDELSIAQALVELELTKPKSDRLAALLAETENQISPLLAQYPRRGVKVLQALKTCQENAVFNPGAGLTLGLLITRIF